MSDSDNDDENIIRYGTPLEPYEEDEIPSKRKYQEPADQYAVDAHGRRRFHGAFTGGFSAGFGNTVGSQEGWTPATFKSSRSEKASVSGQRPEDYMDEEDRSEFGIAPKHVQTSIEYTGKKRPRARGFHDGPIPGEPVLEQLLRPVQETCAVQMLRSMGWRPGQGAGTRRTQADKRADKEQHRVYGCYMPPDMRPKEDSDKEDVSDSEVDYETLFAPDDYEPYVLNRKNDRFGLGYQGLSRHSVLGNLVGEYGSGVNSSHLVMKEKGKKVSIRGQAFGVGAFEADDEDIYATEDMSHYDFALGSSRDKQKVKPVKSEGPNVLPGFTRATKPLPAVPSYPPPALPRDYVPVAAGTRRSRFEPTEAPQRDQGLGRHELTAEARGELLGETPPPKNTQANTQTDTKKNDILAKIMGRNLDFVSTSDTTPDAQLDKGVTPNCESIVIIDMTKPEEQKAADFISIKDSGKELTKIFKPFVNNPKKQARYEAYCEKGVLDRDGDIDQLSEWEREREMVEFEQAAKLYRPLTGIMGDRFTHASQPDDAVNPLSAVAKSGGNRGAATAEQRDAAQRGVYGVMTRHEAPWRPDSVVCKRFNVPEPNVTRLEPKKEDRPKISYSVFSYMESSVHDKDSFTKEQGKFSGSKSHLDKRVKNNESMQTISKPSDQKVESTKPITEPLITHDPFKRMTVAELFLKESESTKDQGKEVTETIEKFDKMDLYKSIFLSDSEEEPENDKSEDKETDFIEVPKNVVRNTSPPRGIFANIDFDELNSWRRNHDSTKNETDKNNADSGNNTEDKLKSDVNEDMDTETYGPKIPDSLKQRLETVGSGEASNPVQVIDSTSSNDSWVDLKEVKAKKSKKKNKKHKSKHKVKKSKHKKKER